MIHTQTTVEYLRPLGERWSILLMEEVEELVLLVQSHHLTDSLIVLLLLLQRLDTREGPHSYISQLRQVSNYSSMLNYPAYYS